MAFVALAAGCFLLARLVLVFEYRRLMLQQIQEAAFIDSVNGYSLWRSVSWRKKELDTVSFTQMLFQFWIPVSAFYWDKSFLLPQKTGKEGGKM